MRHGQSVKELIRISRNRISYVCRKLLL